MSLEVNPVGYRCGSKNGGTSCAYCYQIPIHGIDDPIRPINLDRIKQTIEAGAGPVTGSESEDKSGFSLFGGEPLLAPIETLAALWSYGLERFGKNGVQTGGRPITAAHHELFRKYKVNVSFSIDGPGELNDARRAGTLAQTREVTAKVERDIERCAAEKTLGGVIVTLHRTNVGGGRLPVLLAWIERLCHDLRISGINVHALEHDGAFKQLELTHAEALAAHIAIWRVTQRYPGTFVSPYADMLALLAGVDRWTWNDGTRGGVGCIWTGCDPSTTPAVYGVDAQGERHLCQRVNKTRTVYVPAAPGPLVRVLALRDTPQEHGGCQGCRQMITCKGNCPGTAIDGDWRNRSRDCETWKGLLEFFEGELVEAGVLPVTLYPNRDEIEARLAEYWSFGMTGSLVDAIAGRRPGQDRPDHTDHRDHTDHIDHDDLSAALAALPGGEPVCEE